LLSKVSQYLVCTRVRDACTPCQVAATRTHFRGKREQRAQQPYMACASKDVIEGIV
jgi:hypothetical protein